MVPLLAFLLFAGQPLSAAGPAPPRAYNPGDFRLAAEVVNSQGAARAVININETSTTADGHPWARVYMFGSFGGEAHAFVSYVKFDCAARSLFVEHIWSLDRNLDVSDEWERGSAVAFGSGSVGDQQVTFMCSGRAYQMQRTYLGSDWKSAIRTADANFR